MGSGPISMDNVFCEGTESLLVGCSYSAAHNCYHSEDASVICVDTQCKKCLAGVSIYEHLINQALMIKTMCIIIFYANLLMIYILA